MTSLKSKKGLKSQITSAFVSFLLCFVLFQPSGLNAHSMSKERGEIFSNAFITTWKTDNPGPSEDNQIEIPINLLSNYNYSVDWGDGTSDTNVTTAITHTYAVPGVYTVSITGEFPVIGFANLGTDKEKIMTIQQWGEIQWSRIAFQGCINLDVLATDTPDLSQVTTLSQAFLDCSSLIGNFSFNDWDVSNVETLSGMFWRASSFNQNLNNWDTSNIRFMSAMFNGATSFNQPLDNWDVSKVETMRTMFLEASSFNQNIESWNISSVTDLGGMFARATSFNKPLNLWNTISITDMGAMFSGASSFNQQLSSWDTNSVNIMTAMFQEAVNFDQNISNWNTGNVTNMTRMFFGATSFDQEIGTWNTSNVMRVNSMFEGAINFNGDISSWNMNQVTDFGRMFRNASAFNADIGNWDVSSATRMIDMFFDATSFNQNLGEWNVSSVSRMENILFNTAMSTENYDALLIGWSQLNLQNDVIFEARPTQYCFGASARQSIIDNFNWDITDGGQSCPFESFVTTWKTDNPGTSQDNQVTIPTFPGETYNYTIDWGDGTSDTGITGDITHTYASVGTYTISISGTFPRFYCNNQCDKEKILTVQSWGDIEWTSMDSAFEGCSNLDILAQDTPDLSQVTSLFQMFDGCRSLVGNESFNNWNVGNIIFFNSMFNRAAAFSKNLSSWDLSSARSIDNLFSFSGFNKELNSWDVSGISSMNFVFSGNSAFNKDLQNWDVGSATSMIGIFQNATSFNGNISSWNMSSVRRCANMFRGALVFNGDISGWNTSSCIDMEGMFESTQVFNINIGSWNMENVRSTAKMFKKAKGFNQSLNSWNVGSVSNMSEMFEGATLFNGACEDWNVSQVTDMKEMFLAAMSFNRDISSWDVGLVSEMSRMFAAAQSFDQPLGSWNVSSVTNMTQMMNNAGLSIENYDQLLNGWNGQTLQENVSFDAGSSQFCNGGIARQNIIDTFNWTIIDEGPETSIPVILCPENIVAPADSVNGSNLNIVDPSAIDNCSLDFIFLGLRSDGLPITDAFPIGETSITWTTTDAVGNVSQACTQTIIVEEFNQEPLSITNYFLVNPVTNEDIMLLNDNAIIDIAMLPTRKINIRADATEDTRRVKFNLRGRIYRQRTDNTEPYYLFKNVKGKKLKTGNYRLKARAFSKNKKGKAYKIKFKVINSEKREVTPYFNEELLKISLYPNPAVSEINIRLVGEKVNIDKVYVYDLKGRLLLVKDPVRKGEGNYQLFLNNLEEGVYLMNLYYENKQLYQKRVVIKK